MGHRGGEGGVMGREGRPGGLTVSTVDREVVRVSVVYGDAVQGEEGGNVLEGRGERGGEVVEVPVAPRHMAAAATWVRERLVVTASLGGRVGSAGTHGGGREATDACASTVDEGEEDDSDTAMVGGAAGHEEGDEEGEEARPPSSSSSSSASSSSTSTSSTVAAGMKDLGLSDRTGGIPLSDRTGAAPLSDATGDGTRGGEARRVGKGGQGLRGEASSGGDDARVGKGEDSQRAHGAGDQGTAVARSGQGAATPEAMPVWDEIPGAYQGGWGTARGGGGGSSGWQTQTQAGQGQLGVGKGREREQGQGQWPASLGWQQVGRGVSGLGVLPRGWTSWQELEAAVGDKGTTVATHGLHLRSAYCIERGYPGVRQEPEWTTQHDKYQGTVDYIWHSPSLVPVRVLDTPTCAEADAAGISKRRGGLLTAHASDHLPLVCDFEIFAGSSTNSSG
eukprot:jgi/Mesvir1/27859/Mv07528-RA.1